MADGMYGMVTPWKGYKRKCQICKKYFKAKTAGNSRCTKCKSRGVSSMGSSKSDDILSQINKDVNAEVRLASAELSDDESMKDWSVE